MHVLSSTPEAEAIMHGRNAQRRALRRAGRSCVVQCLDPLLDNAVLFASAPAPEPGRYVLHWVVKSILDEGASEGMIPFSVSQ